MAFSDPLAQKDRQLEFILALDHVRDQPDSLANPAAMFASIARFLRLFFEADGCAIALMEKDDSQPETVAAVGMSQERGETLCRLVMQMNPAHPIALEVEDWAHTLAVPIVLDQPMGGVFLGRKDRPFTPADTEMLKLAESQIDSAVIQARTTWKLAQRNLELETLYQIDRMCDANPEEQDLIAALTGLAVERFQAELCLLLMMHVERDENVLRAIVDKFDLSPETLIEIRRMSDHLSTTQSLGPIPGMETVSLLGAPFVIAGARLGVIIIGRSKPFLQADARLLHAMTSRIDSAIVHSRLMQQLRQRNRELEAIYRIDQIRDKDLDFDQMLQQVLNELCKAVTSEVGYLMLYNATGDERLELKASNRDGLVNMPDYLNIIKTVSREAIDRGQTIVSNQEDNRVHSIVAVPLILNERIIGVFGVVNGSSYGGFSAEDRRMLTAITSQVDTAVFEQLERRRMRKVLSRSVDPKVMDHLLRHSDANLLTGERVVLSVLFADLRGSTEWAERTAPEELVSTLNLFLEKMVDVIFKHGGTLDKFVGDEVIALFGSPIHMEDHAVRAAEAALEMQVVHAILQAELRTKGRELPDMGIGISSGEVITGEFGPSIRTDFTAMGRVMNLGARLCGVAAPEEIIISEITKDMIASRATIEALDPIQLKGLGSVATYKLKRLI